MDHISLEQLLNYMWYSQKIKIRNEHKNILFDGNNYSFSQNNNLKHLNDRWVRKYGTINNVMIIDII